MIIEVMVDLLRDRYSNDLKQYDKHHDIKKLKHYIRMINLKGRGVEPYKSMTKKEIYNSTKHFIDLYSQIKIDGFKHSPYPVADIYEDGNWKIKGGYHRISILKHLKYKTIKIDFNMHPKFESFYNQVNKLYPENRMYQHLDHIVFSAWSCVRGGNRGKLINENIKPGSKVLVIGSYLGVTTTELSSFGHKVTGIEISKKIIESAIYWSNYKGADVTYKNADVVNWFMDDKTKYDVIIMLSVDRWVVKTHGRIGLAKLFNDIYACCNTFIFESRGRHEQQAFDMIKRGTKFTTKKLIGRDDGETKRQVWKFTK